MSIEYFFGKSVKLLWYGVPYVGELHSIDEEDNVIFLNGRYFSGSVCQLPIRGISMIDESGITNAENLLVQSQDNMKYYVVHCSTCARPSSVMPCQQETNAKFTIIGGVPYDGVPMHHEEFKQFLNNLPLDCDACSGITLPLAVPRC